MIAEHTMSVIDSAESKQIQDWAKHKFTVISANQKTTTIVYIIWKTDKCQVTEQHLKQQFNSEKWNVCYLSACGCGVFVSTVGYTEWLNPPKSIMLSFLQCCVKASFSTGRRTGARTHCVQGWRSPRGAGSFLMHLSQTHDPTVPSHSRAPNTSSVCSTKGSSTLKSKWSLLGALEPDPIFLWHPYASQSNTTQQYTGI